MEQYLWVLKSTERDLIRELEPERLALLDEDGLMELPFRRIDDRQLPVGCPEGIARRRR